MAITTLGALNWEGSWDEDGYRSYKIRLLMESTSYLDGPANFSFVPGLPVVGDAWAWGDDLDLQVWCRPERTFTPVVTNEPNRHFIAEFNYSNRPLRRCETTNDNPLLDPPEINITFSRYIVHIRFDNDGKAILSSSYELLPEDVRETDRPTPRVSITGNVLTSNLAYATLLLANIPGQPGPLNDAPLWGLPAQTVRFCNFSSNPRWYGNCVKYYSETMEFEVDYDTWWPWAFDMGYRHFEPEDSGTLYANADPIRDFTGNVCKDKDHEGNETGTFSGPYLQYLDGVGNVLTDTDNPVKTRLKKYGSSNLLLLGIPSSF